MSTPTRHDASDVAFLISGMVRDCGGPWPQGQLQDEEGLDLLQDGEVEGTGADWKDGSYTGLLAMDVDMITPPQETYPGDDQLFDEFDTRSLEVSFDHEDLSTRDQDVDNTPVEVLPNPTSNGHRVQK